MTFFESPEPYQIADKITNCHELAPDLVAHVFLIMQGRELENEAGFFARCAYQQWYWTRSEFNNQFRPYGFTEFNEEISNEDSDVIHNDVFEAHLNKYLEKETTDPIEWFYREIALMVLEGKTYRDIQQVTKINLRYISETMKQFKNDVYNNFYGDSDSDDINHV